MKRKSLISALMASIMAFALPCVSYATEGNMPVASEGESAGAQTTPEVSAGKSLVKTGYVPASLSTPPDIIGESAIVVDMTTGYTLYEKNIQAQHYPASITKIMTATLALENLNMEDVVTFSHDAVYTVEAGSSAAYVNEGEQLTVEQCLYGLLLISGNDLANGLAEQVSGSMDAFAVQMTKRAAELGCTGTQFKNAHGLNDEGHYTTAYDMAIIASNAYQNEKFREICSTVRYVVEPTNLCQETRHWLNNNRMIREGEEYYYAACLGGKTGYTKAAGGTLVTFAEINGRKLVCVILRSGNSADAFADTIKLYDYVAANVQAADFEVLDNKALEDAKLAETLANANKQENNTNVIEPQTTKAKENDAEKESGGFFKGLFKVLLVVAILFGALYLYISYQRYLAKKRQMERRRRRRMQQQQMQRQQGRRNVQQSRTSVQRQRVDAESTIKPRNPNKYE